MIVKLWSCWDLNEGLGKTSRAAETSVHTRRETWCHIPTVVVLRVPQLPGMFIIRLMFYRHKIRYIMIRHELSKSLYIYTYRHLAITKMGSAMGSIYLRDPRAHWHHRTIQYVCSIFHSSLSHTLLPNIHRSAQFVWFIMAGYTFISSHPLSIHLEPKYLWLKSFL